MNPRVERVATSRSQHRRRASTESAAVESSPCAFDHADRRIDHRAQAADRRACRQKARHQEALRHRRFARSGQCATTPLPTHSIRSQTRQTYQETDARTFIAGTRAENADGDPITPSPTVRARLASIRPMRHPTVGARHARRGRPRRRRGTDADPEFRPHFHCRLSVKRPRRHDRRRRRSRSISARVRTPPPRPGTEKRTITIPPRSLPLALTVPVSSLAGYDSRGHAVYRAKHLSPPKRSNLQVRSSPSPRAPPPLRGPAPSRSRLSLTKDPIPPRAGLGRVGRVRERGRIRGDLRRVQRDQHGGRRRQSRRATASLARGSRAGQGPPGEPSESHVFDTSRPENAPALIVFSRPSSRRS